MQAVLLGTIPPPRLYRQSRLVTYYQLLATSYLLLFTHWHENTTCHLLGTHVASDNAALHCTQPCTQLRPLAYPMGTYLMDYPILLGRYLGNWVPSQVGNCSTRYLGVGTCPLTAQVAFSVTHHLLMIADIRHQKD